MNNEPVAWMSEFRQFIGKVQDEICHIPLYAHPAELTDEEIWKCHDETDSDNWVIDFARAILKRAQ